MAEGFDFYAAPRLSPDGDQLAYISWNHPSMPWDSTQLRVLHLEKGSEEVILGDKEHVSVLQPAWSPSGVLHLAWLS